MYSDRQDTEKEVMQLRKENVVLEASLNSKTNENDEIQKEVFLRRTAFNEIFRCEFRLSTYSHVPPRGQPLSLGTFYRSNQN